MSNKKSELRRVDSKPVIVYGSLRSGTTLFRLMLDNNRELSCPGESDFLFDYLVFHNDGSTTLDIAALGRDRIFRGSLGTVDAGRDPYATITGMIRQLGGGQKRCLVMVLHRGLEKALRLLPDAPVVHLLRDPRDVARSSVGMGWVGTVYHGVSHWMNTEAEWDRSVRKMQGGQYFEVRYEVLVRDPQHVLHDVCDFIGVQYDVKMLQYDETTTYSAPDRTLAEQWKRKQSPRELSLVEGRLGGMLARRGYAPSGYKPVVPGPVEALWLNVRNKSSVWKKQIIKYGLIDPVLVGLSRQLGIPRLGYKPQSRIDARKIKFLK